MPYKGRDPVVALQSATLYALQLFNMGSELGEVEAKLGHHFGQFGDDLITSAIGGAVADMGILPPAGPPGSVELPDEATVPRMALSPGVGSEVEVDLDFGGGSGARGTHRKVIIQLPPDYTQADFDAALQAEIDRIRGDYEVLGDVGGEPIIDVLAFFVGA